MRNVMAPGFSLVSWQIYLSIAIGVVASFYRELGQRGFRFLKEMILISMIVGAAGQYYWTGRKTLEGELGAMLELQRWASQSTPKESIFLIEGSSWRGISERRVQVVGLRRNRLLPYMRDRQPLMVETRLQDLYSKFGVEHYSQLTTQNIRELAKEFKAHYILDSSTNPIKSLPIVYANPNWRVYVLQEAFD
jgi:hypothetical protein